MLQKLLQNWPIVSAGLIMILSNIIHLVFMVRSGAADETSWERSMTGILGGLGLMATGHTLASNKQDRVQSMNVLEQKLDMNKAQVAQNKQQADTRFANQEAEKQS